MSHAHLMFMSHGHLMFMSHGHLALSHGHLMLSHGYPHATGYPVVTIGASATIALGNPVNLTCYDAGILQSTFSWTKDGHPVMEDSHLSIITAGSHSTLIFHVLRLEDRGEYNCNTTNPLGSSTHTYALDLNSMTGEDASYWSTPVAFFNSFTPPEILPSYGTIIFIVAVVMLLILVPLVGVVCYFTGRRKCKCFQFGFVI